MAPSQGGQLENVIDEVLKTGDPQALDVFLEKDIHEDSIMKCSQEFLTKLDKLVNRSFDQKDAKSASLGFASLYKCGKNLKLPGCGQGLSRLITQGLIKKMVQWFEKCRQMWIQHGPHWDETLFTLSENFLNALMVVHETCKEGKYKITESFLYPVGQLAIDPRIYILIQKEAIRKYNLILDQIPAELKKERKILTSQEASDIMTKLASRILEGGDYDLQSSLMEALCRMAAPDQRKRLAEQWFTMGHVSSAFAQISDSEFETACRRFLNMVNGMQGDKRRVYSYPCLEVFLGNYELMMPSDEKLEEFWIDFNLGSHSISFYFSLPDEEEGHWETICINKNEVQNYTVTEEGKKRVLQIKLTEVVVVGAVEGSSLSIHFSSCLNILHAARSVYGLNKNKCPSAVKASAKTVTEGNSTQVVPESQVSLGESEKTTAPYILSASVEPSQMVTPAKTRMSESITFICSSGGIAHTGSSLASKLSGRDRDKTPLERWSMRDTTVKTSSHTKTPGSTNAVGMKEQGTVVAEAADVAVAGQGEEKALEHYFIPDTQPRSARSTSCSSWNKLSMSEMLMMPTQKVNFLPRSEPRSRVGPQQERCPPSAQKLSVSDSNLVIQKQLHRELTQRLQKVLSERNPDSSPQKPKAVQKKPSNTIRGSKDKGSENQRGSSLCIPKGPLAQGNSHKKGESKSRMSSGAETVPKTSSLISAPTKTVQGRVPSKAMDEMKAINSNKEKRDKEVAGSMLELISSRYETKTKSTGKQTTEKITQNWIPPLVNRPIFNISWLSTSKSLLKSNNKNATNKQRKDIFDFKVDSPLSMGGGNKLPAPAVLSSTTGKAPPAAQNKRYVKKHLFSDTDTDNAMTEVSWLRESSRKAKPKVTKYSRQALIKPKGAPSHSSFESTDLPSPSPKTVGLKAAKGDEPIKKKPDLKKAPDQPKMGLNKLQTAKSAAASGRQPAAGKRPRRAAATSAKSYREPETDDSQSEAESLSPAKEEVEKTYETTQTKKKKPASKQPSNVDLNQQTKSVINMPPAFKTYSVGQQGKSNSEVPPVKKRKNAPFDKPAHDYKRPDNSNHLEQLRPGNVLRESSRSKNIPVQEQKSALKNSLAAYQTSFCPSPPFIEKMRAAGGSAPTLALTCSTVLTPQGSPLPTSPRPPCEDTPSPILLLPKLHSPVSSKGKRKPSCFHSTEKSHGSTKTKFIPSPCSLGGQSPATSPPAQQTGPETCAVQQHLPSAPLSPLSPSTQPMLTSTLLELDNGHVTSPPQSPFPEDTVSHGCHLEFSKVSSGSFVSVNHSSTKSSVRIKRVKDSSTAALSLKSEKTPISDRELEFTDDLISGPHRKRHNSLSSNSEEEEDKKKSKLRGHRSPRMKPRKLFKSFAEISTVDEVSQAVCSSHVSSSHWESDGMDADVDEDLELTQSSVNPNNICQQMSSELKNKLQNRCTILEIYDKQSSKTIQQHVSSISKQLTKCRMQRLEQVQKVLLEEISKMENDDSILKSMEKDLTMCWKKQMMTFRTYQNQEAKRNENLKGVLQGNACQSLEYEEGIFTSEMGMIRKDMKSIQDRLLNEMLEGEIQSVKRGLRALFFP
ncbi:unnamed protein product [Menidia menidia]|uniref:(Atlantic silverside) hypothetical protein n=1 Tax=Menidia menidia TaxID=238744 RepID=A0A8S4BSP8_9TELE|nr:unnamed protein product [Menidia menidia]